MSQAHKKYPRASFFYVMDNCSAAWDLSQASGEEPPTVFAEKGTIYHRVLARKADPIEELDRTGAQLVQDLEGKRVRLETLWSGGEEPGEVLIEGRLWLRDGLRPIYSGQPDRVAFTQSAERAFITDYKSGWHPLDELAATNSQLRAYVPLVAEHYPKIHSVTVAIVKPGALLGPAEFITEDIVKAKIWALWVVQRATGPQKKEPNRGPWCTYCSGKVLCPLWRTELERLARRADLAVEEIPDAQLAELAPRLALAGTVIEKLQARLRARVRDCPENFPGWHFLDGENRRAITKIMELYDLVVSGRAYLSFSEFLALCKMPIGELEAQLYLAAARGSHALTHQKIRELLEPFVETKQLRDRLVYDPSPKELPQ